MTKTPPQATPRTLVFDAAAVADDRAEHRPGRLVIRTTEQGASVVAAGTPDQVGEVHADPSTLQHHLLKHDTLVPAFVNAHTHLDLSAVGPRPFDPRAQPFADWLAMVLRERPTTEGGLKRAVHLGARLSLAGGVAAVGDIGGAINGSANLTAWRALRETPLAGVSFLEFFAVGPHAAERLAALESVLDIADPERDPTARVRLGLQPHAPYSVEPSSYAHAAALADRLGLPLSTHLSESRSELDLLAGGTGPMPAFLESIGAWNPRTRAALQTGLHPAAHLAGFLASASPVVCAHVNHADDDAVRTLAQTGSVVAWCPRSAAYFGNVAELGPHPAGRLLGAGVPLCIATDSIINLDTPRRISPLDDARLAARHHAIAPRDLLAAITTTPASALGLSAERHRFVPGLPLAGLVAIEGESLGRVFSGSADPRLLLLRNRCALTGTGADAGISLGDRLESFTERR